MYVGLERAGDACNAAQVPGPKVQNQRMGLKKNGTFNPSSKEIHACFRTCLHTEEKIFFFSE